MRRLPSAAVSASAALLLLLCAAPADAHGAANPPRQWSRLLHDYSDDWGGDSGNAYDGHDLIALDLREAYDPGSGRDELVFRLILNGGYGPTVPIPSWWTTSPSPSTAPSSITRSRRPTTNGSRARSTT